MACDRGGGIARARCGHAGLSGDLRPRRHDDPRARVAGDHLSYEQRFTDARGGSELSVLLIDVRHRADVQRWELFRSGVPSRQRLRVWGRRLKANGSFAFLAGPAAGGEYSVYRHDRRGTRLLDKGRGIDPRSFRATRTHVRWRHDGGLKSATFR